MDESTGDEADKLTVEPNSISPNLVQMKGS